LSLTSEDSSTAVYEKAVSAAGVYRPIENTGNGYADIRVWSNGTYEGSQFVVGLTFLLLGTEAIASHI
jgi:hypothetical protein